MGSAEEMDELALMIECPKCGSRAWCVTRSGSRSTLLHAARVEPLRLAYLAGRAKGEATRVQTSPTLHEQAS